MMSSMLSTTSRSIRGTTQESLKQIELFFINQEKSPGSAIYNREAVFTHIDTIVFSGGELFKRSTNSNICLANFELINEICSFCIRQTKPFIRHCIFDSLFSMSRTTIKEYRLHILEGVISMAIGLRSTVLLDGATLWFINTERENSLAIASSIYSNFCEMLPESSVDLRSIIEFCPQFCCVLLSIFYYKFSLQGTSQKSFPNPALFDIILHWLESDSTICYKVILNKDQNFHRWCATYRPTLQYPLALCPLAGLITWCIKSPLSQSELSMSVGGDDQNLNMKMFFNETLQSKLQYLVLKSALGFQQCQTNICKGMVSTEPDFMIWSKDEVHTLIGDILSYCTTGNTDEYFDRAVDKFAQICQIAISTGVLKCSKVQFQSLTDPLPKTRLMDMVAYGPKSNDASENMLIG